QIEPVALASERAADDDVVLDMLGRDAEDAGGVLQLGTEPGLDDPFLAAKPLDRRGLVDPLDRLLANDLPIGFPGPAGRRQKLGIVIRDPDFVEVLAKPDIGGPAGKPGAACDIK